MCVHSVCVWMCVHGVCVCVCMGVCVCCVLLCACTYVRKTRSDGALSAPSDTMVLKDEVGGVLSDIMI